MVITTTVATFVVINARKHLTRDNVKAFLHELLSGEHSRLPRARHKAPIKTAYCGGQMLVLRT